MNTYNIISENPESTVVSEYISDIDRTGGYQTEAELEKRFIEMLTGQGYEYLNIHTEAEMIANLRKSIERLNGFTFSDSEWDRFFSQSIANKNDGIVEKTRRIQEDFVQVLRRDGGESKNIMLIDKKNIHNNRLQVINQYRADKANGAKYDNRYDVTILVNGLPLVHIELKRRGVALREAFNQIDRYQRESFYSGSGLYEYVQIFVISNGTDTKYYSNTTRFSAVKEAGVSPDRKSKTSNSFEFTSYWSDARNRVISDIEDFTKTFFAKHTILNILTKYCVFTSENMLLCMRPYQITATERIINRIVVSHNYKKYGSVEAGGYIWHTTGSGKTLTSFKTARLAVELPFIDKVLFVVDRKDLDYQTMKEYDRFEKGAANGNTSTAILQRQLEDDSCRIIITTIQKLSNFVNKNKEHPVYNKQVVIIMDECHRSQFGGHTVKGSGMNSTIRKSFKAYYMFGFTGTPIFAVNGSAQTSTTEQIFGEKLHTYTIVDAIRDKNVLGFRIDYLNTFNKEDEIIDEQVWDIDRENVYLAPERIANVVNYVFTHFDQKTYRGSRTYSFNALTNIAQVAKAKPGKAEEIRQKQRLSGFNSIFAVSSVKAAKLYYSEFMKQMREDSSKRLRVAVIYSYGANEQTDENGIIDEENPDDTSALDASSREFLDAAIADYNAMFKTNYDTSSEKFPNYYKDVSLRMKNREIDILIVVNMFLTGFDATTLNTLWVDKNLKMHGLIQAFSRTNRILNSIKAFGNIICFRNLQKRVDTALSVFGDSEAGGMVVLKTFKDYYYGYVTEKGNQPGYVDIISDLRDRFPLDTEIIGEQNKKDFVVLFGVVLRMRNLLSAFDEFEGMEILSEREMQDYLSRYNDIHDELKALVKSGESKDINDDIVFEMELVRQIEINIDYILILVQKYHDSNCTDKELLVTIQKSIASSPELRSKKALIESFIAGINDVDDVIAAWEEHVNTERERELSEIIAEEQLDDKATRQFLDYSFRDGAIRETGTDIDRILPPMSRFGGKREKKKQTVLERLRAFFEKFFGIGGSGKFTE